MRRGTRLGGLLALLLVGLITPALIGAPAQATSQETGTPFGISKGAPFAVNAEAEKALGSLLRAGNGYSPAAQCLEPGYVQVFDPPSGQHLHTSFPGLNIDAHAFMVLRHRGIVEPGTRSIWFYRWNNDSAGFNYNTSFANENCHIQEEFNGLSAQNFPVANTVSVSVCFIPWEINQVICGWVGTINRTS